MRRERMNHRLRIYLHLQAQEGRRKEVSWRWKHWQALLLLLFIPWGLFLNFCDNVTEPTHVLVVRGLDETVDEESLHCEFSKYAPLKVCLIVVHQLVFFYFSVIDFCFFWEVLASASSSAFVLVYLWLLWIDLQDLRLVRDKFTSVSRGFAFIHFHSVCSSITACYNHLIKCDGM